MVFKLDGSQKLLCGLLVLLVGCMIVMSINKTSYVMATRNAGIQAVPLVWICPFALLGLIVPVLLRNLGGLLAILSAGLIAGGTIISLIHTNGAGGGLAVSWAQLFLCVVVVISAVVGVCRMNLDFTDIGIDDLLN